MRVHITSSPSGSEIYVDGRFFGNTPSDITLSSGEHAIKITAGGKEWTRTVQITAGEISVHAEIPDILIPEDFTLCISTFRPPTVVCYGVIRD